MTTTTTVIDVECHVLPILRLAHFAAQAGDALHEFHSLSKIEPEFQLFTDKWIPCMRAVAASNPCEVIGNALWAAIDLLEGVQAVDQQNG